MGVIADYRLPHLDALEAEAVHVMREVAAEFERPTLDTGHNFPEVLEFRDRRAAEMRARLVVASAQQAIDDGRLAEERGVRASRNRLQTPVLLDAVSEHRFDALIGGARRDEEKARAMLTTRQQRSLTNPGTAHRLPDPHLTPHTGAFSTSLTTIASPPSQHVAV